MPRFLPFAEQAQETNVLGSTGEVTIGSADDCVSVAGDLEIKMDLAGLSAAKRLRDIFIAIVQKIEDGTLALPNDINDPVETQKNPFD